MLWLNRDPLLAAASSLRQLFLQCKCKKTVNFYMVRLWNPVIFTIDNLQRVVI